MKKVLLASASRIFLTRNSTLLKQRGIQLFTATRGADALKLHEEDLVDLIIADYKLEDMSGCMFCSLIRRKNNVPVIITCQNSPGIIKEVKQSLATLTLLKPIDPIQLLKTVASFLDVQLIRNKRIVLRVKVLCKDQELEFYCLSQDISNTGMLLETELQLELGSRIICQFTLPPSSPIEAEAKVVRSTKALDGRHLCGVRFIDLPLSCNNEIDNYVAAIANSLAGTPNSDSQVE